MQGADDAAAWEAFYVMAGGAAAVLTGLIFVALSAHAKAIMARPLYRDRAVVSIQSLMAQVFLSAAVLVPDQGSVALGIEVELIAAYFLARTIVVLRRYGAAIAADRGRRRSLWIMESIAWSAWLILVIASGPLLAIGTAAGYYVLALSMVYMFASNVWSAWVLIAEVSE